MEVRHASQLVFRNVLFRVAPAGTITENVLDRHTLQLAGLDIPAILHATARKHQIVDALNLDSEETEAEGGRISALLRQLDIDHASGSLEDDTGPLDDDDKFLHEIGTDTLEERKVAIQEMLQRSSEGLTSVEQQQLKSLVNEYADIFRIRLGREAPARVTPMTVSLRPNARPVRAKVRPYSTEKRTFLNAYVANLVDYGYLEPNPTSEWAAAPNLVHKPGPKRFRMTIDLRPVNAATIPVSWPMPHIESESSDFAGSTAFATIDYCSGYWQLPLDKSAQQYHSIVTPTGVYSSTRTLQGATNSAANFQSKVEPLYSELRAHLKAWLDDFILHATSFGLLLRVLRKFFAITREYGLFLSAPKTTLYSPEAKWCGRIINASGVRLDPAHYELLANLSAPTTAGELCQFVHAITWMHHSIPEFARRIAPLRNLLERAHRLANSRRKSKIANMSLTADLAWRPEHATAYEDLQAQLRASVTLAHYDPCQVVCVHTDASSAHWAGVVTQTSQADLLKPKQEQRHQPLAFLGGSFNARESSWTTFEQEGYAVVAVFKRLAFIFESATQAIVYTDHRNLLFAFAPRSFRPDLGQHTVNKVQRWAQYLSKFKYQLEHVDGAENHFPDMLTRWAVGFRGQKKTEAQSTPSGRVSLLNNAAVTLDLQSPWPTPQQIIDRQRRSRELFPKEVVNGNQPRDCLWTTANGQVWVPSDADELKVRLLVIAHCGNAGHRGRRATLEMLQRFYWWTELERDVNDFCHKCLLCLCTVGGLREPRPLGSALHGDRPGEVVHFDYLFLCPAETGRRYVLVVRDDLSSYTWLCPADAPTAEHAAETLARWWSTFRVPDICVSDGGSHFRNTIFKELADRYHFRHHVTTAYTPWANGTAERAGREVLRAFRVLAADLKVPVDRWPELALTVQSLLNNSPLERLSLKSPLEVFTGQSPQVQASIILPPDLTSREAPSLSAAVAAQRIAATELVKTLENLHRAAADLNTKNRARQRRHRDKGTKIPNFDLGDYVLVATRRRGHKLSLKWTGPHRVVELVGHNVYTTENICSGQRETVHANRIRFYHDSSLDVTQDLQQRVLESDETLFVVEKFLDLQRAADDDSLLVLTRWKGFTEESDSWEPLDNMCRDVPGLLKKWLLKQPSTSEVKEALLRVPSLKKK